MSFVKLVGRKTKSGPGSLVTQVKINGKAVKANESVELTKEEVKSLEEKGFIFESSNASEAKKEVENTPVVGNDVVAAAPVFGTRKKHQKTN